MGKLQDKLSASIKEAMLSKNELKRDILRVLKGELERERIAKDFNDAAISKAAKKLVQLFEENGNDKGEIEILQEFVLKQMDITELTEKVNLLKSENNYGPSDMGKVMAYFRLNFEGFYDGAVLSKLTKEILA